MNHGFWVWPADPKEQRKVLNQVANSEPMLKALRGITKSKAGLSNSEVDNLIADNSNWITLWIMRQLTSLGFIEYKVDFFGGPAKYQVTELGRDTLALITGQPVQPKTTLTPQPQQIIPKA